MIKLGEKIKSLRKQKNISQEVLANYLGVSFQAVSKWENDSTMNWSSTYATETVCIWKASVISG